MRSELNTLATIENSISNDIKRKSIQMMTSKTFTKIGHRWNPRTDGLKHNTIVYTITFRIMIYTALE